jgi:subtilisin family serine protease
VTLQRRRPLRARCVPSAAWLCALTALLAAFPGDSRAQNPQPDVSGPAFVPNELIVRLADGGSAVKLAALLAKVGAVGVKNFETVDGLYVIALRPTMSVASASQLARQLEGVVYAEPNYIVKTQTVPNDPSFGTLWNLHNTGQDGGTPGADIHAPEAWDLKTGSSNVVVALLDTGIDYNHQDLAANMFRNEADCNTNGIDDDGNGSIDDCYGIDTANHDSDPFDDNGHGTHTAGIVGAAGNNGLGVVGVNWTVRLMPCKFLDNKGSGSTADAVTCLGYVARMKDLGVNIVATNNSWGGGGFSQALYDAIDAQRQRGILFIAAAGNSGSDNDATPTYPASYDLPNVIAVASTTRTDALSSFSNRGRRTVHVGAPGSEILSTTPGDNYALMSGTSMATPHVAGVAALLKARDPSRDWRAIRNLILAGGDNNSNLTTNTVTGKRLNAFGSLSCSNSTVFSRLKPVQNSVTGTVGSSIRLAALNINCGAGNGNVAVNVSPGGQVLTLTDDGTAPDQVAGDGIYSASFVPGTTGQFVLTFPNGETVNVQVLSSTPYTVQQATFAYRNITGTNLGLGDDTSAQITPPFPINFAGGSFNSMFVSSNGTLTFTAPFDEFANTSLPSGAVTGPIIAPFWDDLFSRPGTSQNVFWAIAGTAPNRELVVEWRDVTAINTGIVACSNTETIRFQVVFFEGRSQILFNYADASFGGSCSFRDGGASATIGVQISSAVSRQYSFNSATVTDNMALLWTLPGPTGTFTDDPLTAGATPIKAVHFTELRSRIDALRVRFGLAAFPWTDASLGFGSTAKAVHLTELRTALQQAYVVAGQAAPTFTDPTIVPGSTFIKVAHITELRDAVLALEGS